MMLKTMRKHGVTLALFAAGSTGLTAAINELTKSTIDQQEAKPRTLHRESIVLDGGRMNTLDHLNQTPQSWIRQQYAQQGYTVAAIHNGESLTAKVDTGFLWKLAALDAAAAKAGKSVAKLLEGGAAV